MSTVILRPREEELDFVSDPGAAFASQLGVAPDGAGTNLVPYGSFERTDRQWGTGPGWQVGVTVPDAVHGAAVARFTATGSKQGSLTSPLVPFDPAVPVYNMVVSARFTAYTNGGLRAVVRSYAANGAFIEEAPIWLLGAAEAALEGWQRYTNRIVLLRDYQLEIVVPPTTTGIRIAFVPVEHADYTVELDALQLTVGSQAAGYQPASEEVIDGSQITPGSLPGDAFDTTPPAVPTDLVLTSDAVLGPDGTTICRIYAQLTHPTDSDYAASEVQITGQFTQSIPGDPGSRAPNWTAGRSALLPRDGVQTMFEPVIGSAPYWGRARSMDTTGNRSDWCPVVFMASALDHEPPPIPVIASTTRGIRWVAVKWTAVDATDISRYEVRWRKRDTVDAWLSAFTTGTTLVAPALDTADQGASEPPIYYEFQVRAIDLSGNIAQGRTTRSLPSQAYSAGATAIELLDGTGILPGSTVVFDGDATEYSVRAVTPGTAPKATLTIQPGLVDALATDERATVTFDSAVAVYGDASAGWSEPADDYAMLVVGPDIETGAIDIMAFAPTISPIKVLASLPALPDGDYPQGRVVFLTTDNKLYRSTGTAWTAVVPTADLTGTISADQIAANAVTSDKIAANAVIAGKIQAGAVGASEIAAHVITTEKMAIGSFENLISNPGFEQAADSYAPWGQVSGGGTWAVAATNPRGGANALTFDPTGQTGTAVIFANGSSGINQNHSAAEGNYQYAEVWARAASATGNNVYVVAEYRAANGTVLGYFGGTQITPTTTYQRAFVVAGPAPAGTAYVTFSLRVANSGRAPVLYLDDAFARQMFQGYLIVDGSITTDHIASRTILAGDIATETITANEIAAGTITAAEIAANTITAAKIFAGTITATEIAADTITANQIAANAITATELAAGAVTADKISVGNVGPQHMSGQMLDNPGFESLLTSAFDSDAATIYGWASGTATARVDTTIFRSGRASLRLAGDGGQKNRASLLVPVSGGRLYGLAVWRRGAAGNAAGTNGWIIIDWYNYNRAYLSSSTATGFTVGTSTTWTRTAQTATAPTGAVYGRAVVAVNIGATAGSYIYFDDIEFYPLDDDINHAGGDVLIDSTGITINNGKVTIKNSTAATIIDANGIAANAVTTNALNAGAVTAAKIATGTITANELAANSVDTSELNASAVTAAKIAAGTITATELAANSVDTSELNAGAVTAAKIAALTITASEIAAGTITSGKIAANTITGGNIAAGAITASELSADSVISGKIAAGAISATAMFVASVVTDGKIGGDLTARKFGAASGGTAAPGFYFDADGNHGFYRIGAATTGFTASGTLQVQLHGAGVEVSGGNTVSPTGAANSDLGTASKYFGVIHYASLSQHSDARSKVEVQDTALGIDFVRLLRPISYRWKETSDTHLVQAAYEQVDKTALEAELAPLQEELDLLRASDPEDLPAQRQRIYDAMAAIQQRYFASVEDARTVTRPGVRRHYGFIAQEVKAALDAAGVDTSVDGGFWFEDGSSGNQSLDYTQLIAVLVKGVQQLVERVEKLEGLNA